MTFSAKTLSVRQLLGLGTFEPARAQRDYQWERRQWSDLITDLLTVFRDAGHDSQPEAASLADPTEADEQPSPTGDGSGVVTTTRLAQRTLVSDFYLGHLILLKRSQMEAGYFIYDGQQRLTTLCILFSALRDAEGSEGNWEHIQALLRTPPPEKAARLRRVSEQSAIAVILESLNGTRKPVSLHDREPGDRRMFEAAAYFLDEVGRWSSPRRAAFLSFLLDRVFLTVTFLEDRRVAEYAYITINTRGKPLENKDIVKGHLVQLASQQSLGAANEIAQRWDRLEAKFPRKIGAFLRAAYLLKFRTPAGFDFGARLMDTFHQREDVDRARRWLDELELLAPRYRELVVAPQASRSLLTMPKSDLRRLSFLPEPLGGGGPAHG
jgi:hypothetical protein